MYRTVLVPLNGVDQDALALATALVVAQAFQSHLDCLHVSLTTPALVWEGQLLDVITGMLYRDLLSQLKGKAAERSRRARETFARFCQQRNVPVLEGGPPSSLSASWRQVEGHQVASFVAAARLDDLVVVAPGMLQETDPAADLATSLVLSGGRPVLVASTGQPLDLTCVAIAWKDTRESARALTAAMPILKLARRILILSAVERGQASRDVRASGDALVASLRWHGCAADSQVVEPHGSTALAVLEEARKAGAGLLVMGGYGHQRATELLLGGFTRDAMDSNALPLLIFH